VNTTQKHGTIQHPDGSFQTLYRMESPEPWLEDFGRGRLINGKTYVRFAPDFAVVMETSDYHVQERNKETSGGAFSYRVIARLLRHRNTRGSNEL
jgi:hypothetical protein